MESLSVTRLMQMVALAAITFVSESGWHPKSGNGAAIRKMTGSKHHPAGRIPEPRTRGCAG
ncbi:hypothetical protein VI01_09540 [Pantoea sp. SM3]|nr:hypothetical protein VI01_09540 [Pantoea sp. SM3]